MDLSVWSRDEYLEHWRQTARRCVSERTDVLFCSSISKSRRELVVLWPAFWHGETVVLFNWFVKRSSLRISGLKILLKDRMSESGSNASRWEVPVKRLTILAGAGGR